jgi:hypothetical protein
MSIKCHRRVYLASFLVSSVAGFALGFVILALYFPRLPAWLQFSVFCVVALGFTLIHRLVFHRFVGATCPACAGRCLRGKDRRWEVVYRCKTCSFVCRTGVFED